MKKPTAATTAIVPISDINLLARAGEAANHAASRSVFKDYQSRKAKNTLRRQANDLALFSNFLKGAGLRAGNFEKDPKAWGGITWGLVEGFARWQLQNGYAVPSVNVRLATVKTYAKLAMKAGALDSTQCALIKSVQGYSYKEGKRIDDQRREADLATRKGAKKSEAVSITPKQAAQLMKQPDTPQGRRDSLLMCLLLDHGLRVGEAVILEVKDFDLKAGELTFIVRRWIKPKLTN